MKRTLLLITCVIATMTMFAQQSMLDGNPVWVYEQEVEWNVKNAPENTLIWNEPMYFIHTYTIKGDTTIQGKVYKKLYHEFQNETHQYLFGTNGGELVTPLREEGNKILAPRSFYQQRWGDAEWYYEMEGSNNDEIVVYDFDALKKGKVSIEQKGQIFSHFIVTTVEKRLADKTLHQVYDFGSDKDETSQQKTLLQITDGIGCNKDNVLLFAPFADDSFILPDEIEAEMTIETHTMTGIYMYPTEDEDSYSRTYRTLECTWDWGTFGYTIYEGINKLTIDDTWVRTTEDGKMMVTLEKFSHRPSSILCYYVQNGKIVYQNTGWNIGYHFIEKYLDYHINEEAEMVDLGLSVKWSTHNVGAASAADFGQYFFWGDTIGTERPSDDLQSVAYTGHYSEYENRLQNHIAKTKFDAAYRLQGKNWRMPTDAEYKELIDSCTCVEVYMNHADGYLLTGPNGNTLFLPKTDGMSLKQNGMSLSSEYNNEAVYWTETLIENNNGNKVNVKVYHNNQLKATTRYDSHYSTHPPKALPIRAVYDESGDKWLSVNEYLYYNRYDLIKWGWNENDVVIPSIEACNDFFARHQDVFGVSDGMDNQMVHQVFCENFRRYVADRFETYKSRAVDTYEGSDGKTLYFVDQIDDDLLDVFDARLGQVDLLAAINLEEDDRGNPLFTKNCTYKMEDVDPKFGVPGNQYLYAIPTSQSAQPYIGFNLPSLLANTNYTIRITMAPEAIDSIAPQPNQFRINMFFKGIEGDWPKTRNFVFRNPLDPTGKTQNFTSSADTLTVIDLPLTLDYATDVMVQLQAYVSSADAKTYSRHLRIANIEVFKNDSEPTPQIAYRPFVEEGKVWKVQVFSSGTYWMGRWQEYYYFDGDTIIDGQIAKRMMYVEGANEENWVNGIFTPANRPQNYVGAFYEKNRKVYYAPYNGGQQFPFEQLYDFTLSSGDSIARPDNTIVVVNKMSGGIPGFKGTYYEIGRGAQSERWFEGVGSESWPHHAWMLNGNKGELYACTVGDEVIYLNEQLLEEQGIDDPDYAKKRRFDFNHTVKTQPKAPGNRNEAIGDVYGEYNSQQLNIVLGSLDDAYVVRITNQKTGETLYEKAINAGSIVALNIDISAYPEGQYEITIDNSNETFNGVIDTTTGIDEIVNGKSLNSKSIYNINGQRIGPSKSSLKEDWRGSKGVYIVDGKKIFIK